MDDNFDMPLIPQKNPPMTALQRAATKWGSASVSQRLKDGGVKSTVVHTTACLVCGANVPYGRGVLHMLDHVRKSK